MADSPFIVAHRAGNDLAVLAQALRAGSGLIEADVHLFHARVVALPQLVAWCCSRRCRSPGW